MCKRKIRFRIFSIAYKIKRTYTIMAFNKINGLVYLLCNKQHNYMIQFHQLFPPVATMRAASVHAPSHVQLFVTPWIIALQVSSVHGQEYWRSCHFLLQGIFLTQESNLPLLHLLHWQVGSLPAERPGNCCSSSHNAHPSNKK